MKCYIFHSLIEWCFASLETTQRQSDHTGRVDALIFISIFHCGSLRQSSSLSEGVRPGLGLGQHQNTDTVYQSVESCVFSIPYLHCTPPLRNPNTQKRVKHTVGRCIDVRHTTLMVVSIVDILPRPAWFTHLGALSERFISPPPSPPLSSMLLYSLLTWVPCLLCMLEPFVGESRP